MFSMCLRMLLMSFVSFVEIGKVKKSIISLQQEEEEEEEEVFF